MFKVTTRTLAATNGEAAADREVLALVKLIEDAITTQTGGSSAVEMTLPVMFPALQATMDQSKAQTLVYGRLLSELDVAGFTSTIVIGREGAHLTVRWKSALDPLVEREMREVIKQHLPRPASASSTAPPTGRRR